MSRNAIIMILYIMMFLVTAYLKFINPHLLDQPKNELTREILTNNGSIIIGDSLNEVRNYWPLVSGRHVFSFKLAKQIDQVVINPEGKTEYRLEGETGNKVNVIQEPEPTETRDRRDRRRNTFQLVIPDTSFANHDEIYFFYKNKNNYQMYHYTYQIKRENNTTSIIKYENSRKSFQTVNLEKQGSDFYDFLELNHTKDITHLYVYKRLKLTEEKTNAPYSPDKQVLLDVQKIGSVSEQGSSAKTFGNQKKSRFTADIFKINLLEGTYTKEKTTFEDSRVYFPVIFNIPEAAQLAGNYADIIQEVSSGGVTCPMHIFHVGPRGATDFQLIYPPENYQVRLNIPVGTTYKQTVSATFPIDRFTLSVEGKVLLSNLDITTLSDGNPRSLPNGMSITSSNQRTVLDIDIPVSTTQDISARGNTFVKVSLQAYAGAVERTRNWLVEVIPYRFQVWPPITPQRMQGHEQDLLDAFVRSYRDESRYPVTRQQTSGRELVYETRDVNVFYSLKNVNTDHIKNIIIRTSNGEEKVEYPNDLGYFVYKIGRDVRYVDLIVNTKSNHSHPRRFLVKSVPNTGLDLVIRSDGSSGIYTAKIDYKDYFNDPIEINRVEARSQFSPNLSYNLSDDLIFLNNASPGDRLDVTLYYTLKYESSQQREVTPLNLPNQ